MYPTAAINAAYKLTNAQLWKEIQAAGLIYPKTAKGIRRDELVGIWLEHCGSNYTQLHCPEQNGERYQELRIVILAGAHPCDVCGMPKEWHC